MNETLKVLMIEDSAIDAELILNKLSEMGCQVEHGLVDNALYMRRLINEKQWDIVLCDYSMPDFNIFEALNIIREFNLDIPFIVISGTIGEEKAIELLKAGCHDCIMKNNMTRLPEVINRECKEARVRKENRILNEKLQKYQILAEEANDAMLFIDIEGNIQEVNRAAIKKYGYSYEEFLIMKIFDLRRVNNKKLVLAQMEKADKEGIVFETIHHRKDNSTINVEVSSRGAMLGNRRILLCIVRDITERKLSEAMLKDNEERYKMLSQELAFQNEEKEKRAAELIIANKELVFQNEQKDKRAAELVLANKELIFQNEEKADRAAELVIADEELVFQIGEKADRAAELLIANKELAFQSEEKDKRAAELIIANKDLALKNKELSYVSYHDFLTGLYNRIYFEEEKKRLDTPRQLLISIIMGDVNGLKLINDGFGHSKGDEVLIEIAKILISCCRKEDIVSRTGGDEFGILLPKTDSQSAQRICDSICDTCKGYELDGSSIYPSISVGHATKNISTETMDNILMAAEEYMSRQKLLESKSTHSSIIASIKAIMFEKSQETEEHAERMAQLSKSIGRAMSLTDDQLNKLELLSTLHDIGKMGVDAKILSKPGKLSDEEWAEMRKHPEVGFRIAQATSELIPIADYILSHHERWDGKGYPQGLIGEKIPLLSRIVAIADSFDAMTNDRAYRVVMTKEEAIEEIRKCSGTQFDPEVARVFIEKVLGQEWEQLNKI